MAKCYECRAQLKGTLFFCKRCEKQRKNQFNTQKVRRALTDYEKLKLSWYRDEKKWHENIRQRQIVKDSFGNKVPVLVNDKGEITARMPGPRDRY